MYEFWDVFLSFVRVFIVFEPFYIMVASALLYGVVGLFRYLLGGGFSDR